MTDLGFLNCVSTEAKGFLSSRNMRHPSLVQTVSWNFFPMFNGFCGYLIYFVKSFLKIVKFKFKLYVKTYLYVVYCCRKKLLSVAC